ncbi:MAG TPA: Ig-like domain-containing protein [Tepidisphaeraceae bacterium]|nr:Ig-like domain-containing protein [Tepidisphaeraceae bacterium]
MKLSKTIRAPRPSRRPRHPFGVEPLEGRRLFSGAAATAVNDSFSGFEDVVVTGNVVTNDTDGEGDTLLPSLTSVPLHGGISMQSTGVFTYTPHAGYNGSDSFTYSVWDGSSWSASATVTITLGAVNDAPSFTTPASHTSLEDGGFRTVLNFATALSAGPPDEAGQGLAFTATTNNDALFSILPGIASDGTLTYRAFANANGSATVTVRLFDDGGTANGGVDASATRTFTINVTAVNDAPTFAIGDDQSVTEDAGPQSVSNFLPPFTSPGPADEAGQTVSFELSNDNASLFSVQPAFSGGVLTYTPAANANGTATVTMLARDSGGTANGGVNASAPQTFQIHVSAVNDPPVFSVFSGASALEDAPAQEVTGFAHAVSGGPDDEAGQSVWFTADNDSPLMFLVQPHVAADGTLTYTPFPHAVGTATVTVHAQDDGGTADGGDDTSNSQTFQITLNPVNDVPVFTGGGDQTVNEDAGTRTVAEFATGILAGPVDEWSQELTFVVTSDNPGLFAQQPAVSADGTLTYRTADDMNGSAVVSVYLRDDGGTANGGDDTTGVQTFTITVRPVNDAPTLAIAGDVTVSEDAGSVTIGSFASFVLGPSDETEGLAPLAGYTVHASFQVSSMLAEQPVLHPSGALTFRTAPNASGVMAVTVYVRDEGGTANGGVDQSVAHTFNITITPVNDAPVGQSEAFDLSEDGSVSGNVLANDSDVESVDLDAALLVGPAHGGLSFDPATGAFTYTPDGGYHGPDSFVYRASDGEADSGDVTVFLTVLPGPNEAPVAADDTASATPGQAVSVPVLSNDFDVDGDSLTVAILNPPAFGTATVNADGTVTYVAGATTAEADQFTYQVSDGNGGVAQATVRVSIHGTGVVTDPDEGTTILVVQANDSDDFVRIVRMRDGRLRVFINGVEQGRYEVSATSKVLVAGGEGDDTLAIKGVRGGVQFFGGPGDDVLVGSAFADVLVGGPGNDLMTGGGGRDLVIGGEGSDTVRGGQGDDIVIAGTTDYDDDTPSNRAALGDLLAAWSGAGDAPTRAAAIWAGVGPSGARLGGRVHDDGLIDTLAGAGGFDAFVALAAGGAAPDVLVGKILREAATTLWL